MTTDRPLYDPKFIVEDGALSILLFDVPWLEVTDARKECFMATPTRSYTYGAGRGVRTYESIPPILFVQHIQLKLNEQWGTAFNGCFLNRYDDASKQLGWHADDSPGMDHEHPIAVISFGESREIWWRANGQTGVVPVDQRQLLSHGSLFMMPASFQQTHQHRIPKGDRPMGKRVSLTYRRFL